MLRYLALLFLLQSFDSNSQDFEIIPLRQGLDTSSLDENIKIRKSSAIKEYSYLDPKKRDAILKKYLPDELKKLDQSDRDLLYKSLINYDEKTLIQKYPYLKRINLKKLKNELH